MSYLKSHKSLFVLASSLLSVLAVAGCNNPLSSASTGASSPNSQAGSSTLSTAPVSSSSPSSSPSSSQSVPSSSSSTSNDSSSSPAVPVTYVFEAEDAEFSGQPNIEYPEGDRASGGKSFSLLFGHDGDTLAFGLHSETDQDVTLGIVLNKPDPFVFEDDYALTLNGSALIVGAVAGNGWDGTSAGAYFDFRQSIDITAHLVAGDNELVFTVVDRSKTSTNMDCIRVTSLDPVRWVWGTAQVFEAEAAPLPANATVADDAKASAGSYVAHFDTSGQSLSFALTADEAATAVLGIGLRMGEPLALADYLTVTVNDLPIAAGEQPFSWSTTGQNFGYLVKTPVSLVAGANSLTFEITSDTAVTGGKLDFDRIVLFTTATVSWAL